MSEPFPTPEYIQECIKHQEELGEEWEKRGLQRGDWCCTENGSTWLFNALDIENPSVMAMFEHGDLIPLFTLRQLVDMLEERGYLWDVGIKAVYGTQDKYRACAFTDKEVAIYLIHTGESWSPLNAKIIWTGPDPEVAMLRAWLEVGKEEQDEGLP